MAQSNKDSNNCVQSKPKALILLADGAEEMEVVITADVLRRGGIDVTLASFFESSFEKGENENPNNRPIICSRDVRIMPDKSLQEAMMQHNESNEPGQSKAASYDIIVIPGGMQGAKTLAGSMKIGQILKRQEAEALGLLNNPNIIDKDPTIDHVHQQKENDKGEIGRNKYLAAICAGPLAFLAHGIGRGRRITSHPSVKDRFTSASDLYTYIDNEDVVVDGPFITSRGPGTTFSFALTIVKELQSKKVADSIIEPMMLKQKS
ncbi:unnamed protein product [Gordionus sp. m RMFG-2023]|uniref:Parkinson disease protein 7 homolog n=1 Tax=Gordionus sp. m RMFG-2023 TaxID=3053472 RepID=UPI0030DE7107